MRRLVISAADLSDDDITQILNRAERYCRDDYRVTDSSAVVVGLIFLQTSLRTRVGFAAAACRLGWRTIEVVRQRSSEVSMPESWQDTLRTVAGYVDLTVARLGQPTVADEIGPLVNGRFLNGGDTGNLAEHPSQALIDLFAIERMRGPIEKLTVVLCGDLRMRTVRSLLQLLGRRPPRRLVLISDPRLPRPSELPAALTVEYREQLQVQDADVLYVAGIPHGALDEADRIRLQVTTQMLAILPTDAVVLSPMPVIDEIVADARTDPRVRHFEQSDLGLFVRMALLERMIE